MGIKDNIGLKNIINHKHGIFLFLFIITAGLAGNRFPFSILNAHFIFGSFFAILALQIFGLGPGILAAFIISSYTYFAWNHPWAIITMTLEVVVAGWLFSRRKMSLPLADMLYWLFIGIPVGYVCFHIIANFPISNTLFLVTKQAANGIANCLAARLVFIGYSVRYKTEFISFREIVSNLLTFFVLCTALVMLTVNSKSDFIDTERNIKDSLNRDIRNVTNSLNKWVDDRELVITNLAQLAQTLPPEQMQARLEFVRSSDPNFLRIALVDKEASVVAYAPLIDQKGNSAIGTSYKDRPHVPILKKSLKPLLSDVMVSRLSPPDPIVMILVPVVVQGVFSGFVAGVMNFDRILETLNLSTFGQNILYTLIDKNDNVIITNRRDQKSLEPFSRREGKLQSLGESIKQFIPKLPHLTSTIQLWGKSLYLAEASIRNLSGWKLLLEQPAEPFQKKLYDRYSGKFLFLFVIVIVSLLISEFLSRRIHATTADLGELTAGLPVKLSNNQQIDWPLSPIVELNRIIDNFKEMSISLEEKFKEIGYLNESLKDRIKVKTEDLSRSEEKYRSMMESFSEPLYICSPDLKINYMNPAMVKRIGRNATGDSCYSVLHGLDSKCEWCVFDMVSEGKTVETSIKSPLDGRNYRLTNMPILNQDGTVSKMTIYSDITDYLQAVSEKEKAQAQLIQAQKMESVGRLAGGVAHDYNNISSIIIGYSELALEKVEPRDPLHDDLMEIFNAAKRSTDITRQLLAFARQQTIAPKVLDLNDTIGNMLKMLNRLMGEDIDIAWLPGAEIWPLKIDPSQVDQILANLCVNARDAILDVGKVTIETENINFDEDYCADHAGFVPGDFVKLAVSDDGTGIPPETLENIFEPFFTTKSMGKGTGLGLATVYGIVKQNNGFINVYSEPERGTSIKIYLPRYSGEPIESKSENNLEIPLSRGSEVVLLVEDDASILKLGKRILEDMGYMVLSANGPIEALNLAEKHTSEINLLITDVVMPEMNGRELSEKLQNLYPGLKTLFMSGYTANVIAHRGVLEDGVSFISKPFSKMDMAIKVRKVLDEIKE